MKKNLFFTMLTLMMVAMFGFTLTSCGDGDGGSGGSGGGTFQGPKRVFGDNLVSQFVGSSTCTFTYDSDNFLTKAEKSSGTSYLFTYEGSKVTVTSYRDGEKRNGFTYSIGGNGYASSYTSEDGLVVNYTYDSDGHVTKIVANDNGSTYSCTFTWTNGNLTKAQDNDGKVRTSTYDASSSNIAAVYPVGVIGGDMGDFYDEVAYYAGLLGKGTANLALSTVNSGSSTTTTYTNTWTLDTGGRAIKCAQARSGYTSNYSWTYK